MAASKFQVKPAAEFSTSTRDHHERVRRRHVGPSGWQREQLPVLVVQVNPVLTPVLPVRHELEIATIQRMEMVRHPHPTVPII